MVKRSLALAPATVCCLAICHLLVQSPCMADSSPITSEATNGEDLTSLSLEELVTVEITSVSRKPEKLAQASAAVYVITRDDIARSGATNIPEALRMVPGLHVAQINSSMYAVMARGFAERWANKLLVLIDGRSVYTPLYSGVWWDVQDLLLEDIDRIEVIRGPGGTTWGANAVNGIINIVTRTAQATQGTYLSAAQGNINSTTAFRFGAASGTNGAYRVYAKYDAPQGLDPTVPGQLQGPSRRMRGGFRYDGDISPNDTLTVQGDVYHNRLSWTLAASSLMPPYVQMINDKSSASGGNLLARWKRSTSAKSDYYVQSYLDMTDRSDAQESEKRTTFDIEFQRHDWTSERHDLVWGFGYRRTSDTTGSMPEIHYYKYNNTSQTDHLINLFIQDELALARDRLHLTLGTKFERNSYTGWEVQPTIRAAYTPRTNQTLWGAVSRAVRTPSRGETSIRMNVYADAFAVPPPGLPVPPGTPYVIDLFGNPDMSSEVLYSYQLGYRIQPSRRTSVDLTAFYNDYKHIRSLEQITPPYLEVSPAPPHIVVPLTVGNGINAQTYGVEIAGNWRIRDNWRLTGSYSWLQVIIGQEPGVAETTMEGYEDGSPANQFVIQSRYNLREHVEFDTNAYYVGSFTSPNMPRKSPDIPRYCRIDFRLAYYPSNGPEAELCILNAFQSKHVEFGTTCGEMPTAIPRSIYGKLTWRF